MFSARVCACSRLRACVRDIFIWCIFYSALSYVCHFSCSVCILNYVVYYFLPSVLSCLSHAISCVLSCIKIDDCFVPFPNNHILSSFCCVCLPILFPDFMLLNQFYFVFSYQCHTVCSSVLANLYLAFSFYLLKACLLYPSQIIIFYLIYSVYFSVHILYWLY